MRATRVSEVLTVAALGLMTACSAQQGTSTAPMPTRTSAPTASTPPTQTPLPCPTGSPLPDGQRVIVHLVDYVVVNGVTYLSNFGRSARPDGPPGRVVARVRCRDRVPDSQYPPRPSESSAAFLGVGTALHATQGLPVTCELQVKNGGRWRAYVATDTVGGKVRLSECWRHSTPAA